MADSCSFGPGEVATNDGIADGGHRWVDQVGLDRSACDAVALLGILHVELLVQAQLVQLRSIVASE